MPIQYGGATDFSLPNPQMTDYQASYNGFSFGAGTNVQIVGADGLDSLPSMRTSDRPRPRDTGQFPGNDFADGREVTFDLLIFDGGTQGVNDLGTTLEALKAATIPEGSISNLPLQFQFPFRTPGARLLYCRPRGRSIPLDANFQFKYARAQLKFWAVDPRWYDATQQVVAAIPPSGTQGLTFNATFDLSFGGALTGGQMLIVNSGNFETRPIVVVVGPSVNPIITNASTGQYIGFNLTLTAADALSVDLNARTVYLNGTSSRFNTLQVGSQWFNCPPGTTTLQFNSGDGSGACAVYWRSTWI